MMLPAVPGPEDADGQHGGVVGADLAALDGLQRGDDLGADHDRVHAVPGPRPVGLPAPHGDAEAVGAGHRRARAVTDGPGGRCARHVQAEDQVRPRAVEGTLLQHPPGAADLPVRQALLDRLEQQRHGAAPLRARRGQHLRRGHQDGDVAVVPAGVHHAHLLAAPARAGAAGKGEVHLLRDRQGVHVGAQRDHGARPGAAARHADHAGDGDALAHLVAEAPQVPRHEARGAHLLVPQFRVLVDVAAPADHARLDRPGRVVGPPVQRARRRGGEGRGGGGGGRERDGEAAGPQRGAAPAGRRGEQPAPRRPRRRRDGDGFGEEGATAGGGGVWREAWRSRLSAAARRPPGPGPRRPNPPPSRAARTPRRSATAATRSPPARRGRARQAGRSPFTVTRLPYRVCGQ